MAKKSKKKKKNKKQQKQQQKQQRPDVQQYTDDSINVVKISSTPLLLRVMIVVGYGMKYLGIFMLVMFAVVMVIASGICLFSDGLKAFVTFLIDFITFWKGENLLFLFIFVCPFFLWYAFAKWMKKYHKERTLRAYADKVVIESKDGKEISLTYEELGMSIRTRKIRIGPDWIEIPYDTGMIQVGPEWIESPIQEGKIRLYSLDKSDIGRLLALVSKHAGIPYEGLKMEENIKEYIIGWTIIYFVGWPIVLLSTYITACNYIVEKYESLLGLVLTLFSDQNPIALFSMAIIIIGYLLKGWIYLFLRDYFKPYKDYFHISW